MNNRRCGSPHVIFTLINWLLLSVLLGISPWVHAAPSFSYPSVSPTSGTVAVGGTLLVKGGGTVRGSATYESVNRIELISGSTVLDSEDYEILYDQDEFPINETRRLEDLSANLPKGTYDLYIHAKSVNGTKVSGPFTITVNESAPSNGAMVVRINTALPSTVEAGRTYPYEVVMQNTGTETWAMSGPYPYSLGSQNPQDNYNWGKARLPIPNNVAPGAQVTIRGNLTAPLAAASYNFAWRMVKDMAPNGWFGDTVSQPAITVQRTKPSLSFSAPSTTSCTPSSGNSCTVTFVGNGTAVSDFSMSSVELYVAGSRIGSGTSSVSATHTLTGIGNHTIELRGTDSRGVQGSTYMTFTVRPPAPTAILTGPADYSTFQIVSGTTYPITLTGSSSATSPATLTNVTIKHDLLGVRTDSYTVSGGNLNLPLNLPPGFHIIYMTATDSYGNTSTSNYLHFTVNAPTPSVSMSAPSATTSKVTATGSALVRFNGSASTPGGTMKRIELVDLSQKVWATINFASGTSGTFDQDVSLPVGEYTMRFKAFNSYDAWAYSGSVNVSVIAGVNGNGAQFVSQSVPSSLRPGEPYNATVTMMNNGTTTWSEGQSYRLGAQKTQDNRTWISTARAYLASSVAPGQSYTFTLPITAPQKVGAYDFQWQMVQDGAGWFGALTDLKSVTVASGTGPTAALNVSPTNSRAGAQGYSTLTFSGSGERSAGVVSKLELLEDSGTGFGAAVASNAGGSSSLALSTNLNRTAGIYKFKLRATDSSGLKTDSEIVTVNVVNSPLLGTVKGVRSNATGAPELYGWVCEPGKPAGLNYQVLLDTPSQATGGTVLTTGVANVGTEPDNAAVQTSCSTTGSPHHFVVNLSSYLAQYAGRSLYVVASNAAGANPIALPCADNSCTMPGTQRVVVATPQTNDKIAAPNPVFMRMQLTNYSGGLDEVGFVVNGEFIPALPDGAGYYAASKNGLAAGRYPVFARVRQGGTTIQSVENQFDVVQGNTVTVTSPTSNTAFTVGSTQTLQATVAGYVAPASVKFFANETLIGTATGVGANWSASWVPTAAGNVNLLARSYDGGGVKLAESQIVTVSISLGSGSSENPIPVAISVPHGTNRIGGTLAGSLTVGDDGASSYSVPVPVPPGSAGMQPGLSLSYSSNGSNGMMGLGWSLRGLSSIHRCAKTIAQDGVAGRISLDTSDRLCLDGVRMVRSSGTNQDTDYWFNGATYRTEIEGFSRISRLTNLGFKVEGKDGKIYYYGTADEKGRIRAVGKPGQVLVWALERVEDRSGNYLTVEYNQDTETGEYTPKQIVYGGNTLAVQDPDLAVRFDYETRGDAQIQYTGGARNDLRTRLTHIRTYINTGKDGTGGTLAHDLEIRYKTSTNSGRSLVDWMQLGATNPTTGQFESLPKTTFDWGDGGAPVLVQRGDTFKLNVMANGQEIPVKTYIGDFDGSGRSSILVPMQQPPRYPNCPTDTCQLLPFQDGFGVRNSAGVASGLKLTYPDSSDQFTEMLTGDMNGDSKDDLVLIDVVKRKWVYCLAKEPDRGDPAFHSCQSGGTLPPVRRNFEDRWDLPGLISLRNDGRVQLLYFNEQNQATACSYTSGGIACEQINTTAPENARLRAPSPIMLSAQGTSDIYSIWNSTANAMSGISLCRMQPSGLTCENLEAAVGGRYSAGMGTGDLNGDGLTDLIYNGKRCLSTETGVHCPGGRMSGAVNDADASGFGYFFAGIGDHTGDGLNRYWGRGDGSSNRVDKLCRMAGDTEVCQSVKVDGLPAATRAFIENQETFSRPFLIGQAGVPAALNCNSVVDIEEVVNGYRFTQTCWITSVESPASQDKLIGVTNGVGYTEQLDYARGDDTSVYGQYASVGGLAVRSTYPALSTIPGVMVKQLRRSNGQGGLLKTDYYYEGASRDAHGRGSLGFALVRVTDQQSNVQITSRLRQDFPFIGMASSVQKSIGTCLLEDTNNTLEAQLFSMPDGSQLRFPYVKQGSSIRRNVDLSNGDCHDVGTVSTVNEYNDSWGNLNVQTTTTSGAGKTFTTVTRTDFLIGPGKNYLSALPVQQTISKSQNGGAALTRTVSYANDSTTGLRSGETIEPGNASLQLTTTYDRGINHFGLVRKQLQDWTDPACSDSGWPETGCVSAKTRTVSDIIYKKGRFPDIVKNAAGHSETHTYDAATGKRISLKGPNGLTTSWSVDGFGRVTREVRHDGSEIRTAIKECKLDCPANATVIQITEQYYGSDRMATPQISYLDSAGHVVRTLGWGFDGRQTYVDHRYDSNGRLYETDQARFVVKKAGESLDPQSYLAGRVEYDSLNRIIRQTSKDEQGVERSATTQYQGLVTRHKNLLLQERIETRNVIGQLEKVTDPNGKNTHFEYEQFGNLNKTIDPNGNEIKVDYDSLGRRKQLTDPNLGVIDYFVDPLGQTWAQRSPKQKAAGKKSYMVYDLLGRMTARREDDGASALNSYWVYDTATYGIGQLAETFTGKPTAKDYQREHSYDDKGRPTVTTQRIHFTKFSSTAGYDIWGRPISHTYERDSDTSTKKSFGLRYNAYGYLERIERGPLVLWRVTEQDAAARVRATALGNGLTQVRSYDPNTGRLSGASLEAGGNSKRLGEGYTYDLIGNVSTRTQSWDSGEFFEQFKYDALNRLEKSAVTGQPELIFTYDDAGNIKSKTGVGTYTYLPQGAGKPQPHAVQSISGIAGSFSYDANGNMVSGAGRVTCWTSFDMPRKITTGGNVSDCSGSSPWSSFTYGSEHQRTTQSRSDGSTIIYAGAQELIKSSSGTTVKTYWPGGLGVEIDRPDASSTELSWMHTDRLGSVVALTNESGGIRHKLEYDAWGKRRNAEVHGGAPSNIASLTDNKGFTGHEMLDQLDLVHMNGRVYDPLTARFLSGDPLISDPENGQRYNRYSYVLNNPTNLIDPTGFQEVPVEKISGRPSSEVNGWHILRGDAAFNFLAQLNFRIDPTGVRGITVWIATSANREHRGKYVGVIEKSANKAEPLGLNAEFTNSRGIPFRDNVPPELALARKNNPELVAHEKQIWEESQATGLHGYFGIGRPKHEESLIVYQHLKDGSLMYDRKYKAVFNPDTGEYSTIPLPKIVPAPEGYRVFMIQHTHPWTFSLGGSGLVRGPSPADNYWAKNNPGAYHVVQTQPPGGRPMQFLYYGPKR